MPIYFVKSMLVESLIPLNFPKKVAIGKRVNH